MPRRIGPRGQLPLHRGLRQHPGIRHQRVDRVDAQIQVVLDLVEVAAILVGDLPGNVPFADPVDIAGRHVQRADDRIQRGVDSLHDRPEVALMPRRIRPRGQLPFHRGRRQHPGIRHQRVDRVDAEIQVVFDLIEVALVVVRDSRRDVALADPVDVARRDVERADHGVQRPVDPLDDLAVDTLEGGGVPAGGQTPLHRGEGQLVRFLRHRTDRLDHALQRLAQDVLFGPDDALGPRRGQRPGRQGPGHL